MKIKLKILAVTPFILMTRTAFTMNYVVQRNDTLSTLAAKYVGEPIYGKQGSLKVLMEQNPQIRDGDRISVGDNLLLNSRIIAAEDLPLQQESSVEAEIKPPTRVTDQVTVSTKLFYSTLSGKDALNSSEATLISKLNYGADLQWTQHWTSGISSFVGIGMDRVSFEQTNLAKLENPNLNLTRLKVGAEKSIGNLSLGLGLGMGQEIFYRGTTSGELALETLSIPRANANFDIRFLKDEPFSLGLRGNFIGLSSGETDFYKVKSGFSYGSSIYLSKELKSQELSAEVFYQETRQGTSFVKLLRKDIGVALNFSVRFGK